MLVEHNVQVERFWSLLYKNETLSINPSVVLAQYFLMPHRVLHGSSCLSQNCVSLSSQAWGDSFTRHYAAYKATFAWSSAVNCQEGIGFIFALRSTQRYSYGIINKDMTRSGPATGM